MLTWFMGPTIIMFPKVLLHRLHLSPTTLKISNRDNLETEEWCSEKLRGIQFGRMVTFEEERGHVESERGHVGWGMGTRGLYGADKGIFLDLDGYIQGMSYIGISPL